MCSKACANRRWRSQHREYDCERKRAARSVRPETDREYKARPEAIEAHRKRRRKSDTGRPSAHRRGYGVGWRRIRQKYLTRHPVCEIRTHCHEAQATDVDHIDGDVGNSCSSNLQSACHACHSAKTVREQGGFGNRHAGHDVRAAALQQGRGGSDLSHLVAGTGGGQSLFCVCELNF